MGDGLLQCDPGRRSGTELRARVWPPPAGSRSCSTKRTAFSPGWGPLNPSAGELRGSERGRVGATRGEYSVTHRSADLFPRYFEVYGACWGLSAKLVNSDLSSAG